MVAPAPVSVYKSFLGIALEGAGTLGTPVLTPVMYFPIEAEPDFEPVVGLLEDKAFRGSPGDVFAHIPGTTHTEVSWSGNLYVDSIGYALVGLLGEVAVSGTNPYTHAIDVLNTGNFQPPTYTLMFHYGMANTKTVAGFMFSELSLKIADGLVTYTAKGFGWTSSDQTKPTPSYSTVPPLPAYFNTVTIGGAATTDMLDGELNIKRNVSPIHTHGAADAASTWGGTVSVDGKATLIMETNAELARFTTPATVVLVWNINGGASNRLQFTMSKAQYLQGTKPQMDPRGFMTVTTPFKADFNTTDVGTSAGYSPLKATLVNAVNTGSYK